MVGRSMRRRKTDEPVKVPFDMLNQYWVSILLQRVLLSSCGVLGSCVCDVNAAGSEFCDVCFCLSICLSASISRELHVQSSSSFSASIQYGEIKLCV